MTDIAASSPVDARAPPGPDLGRGAGARAQALSRRGALPRLRPRSRWSFAAVFLVVLIADIVRKGLPAFTQHSLLLDVAVPADLVEPAKRNDPVAIRSADYFPVTRDALKAAIPGIESRGAERTLTRLLSTGAADRLREHDRRRPEPDRHAPSRCRCCSRPMPISTSRVWAPPIASRPGRGIATPSGTTGEITVLTSANDFADDLVDDQERRSPSGRRSSTPRPIACSASARPTLADRIKELREEAAGYRARVDQPKVEEALDAKLPSLLVAINGGLVKITKLSDIGITGEVLLPLTSTADAKPGEWRIVTYVTPESNRKATDQEIGVPRALQGARQGRAAASTGCSSSPATAASRSLPASAARSSAPP